MKKKIISIIFYSLIFSAAFAETYNYEEFSLKVMKEFPFAEYIGYSVWEDWNGDADKFIQHLKDNPTDLDDAEVVVGEESKKLFG